MSLPHTGVIFDNRKEPTSSHVSAPSKLLIVTQPSTIKLPNHPPSVLRKIPEAINRRLSHISSVKQSFEAACPPYQEALSKSGYEFKLHYNTEPTKPKRTRSRNVIWFNPPYSAIVATNIGHKFLKAIDECFPSIHPLHKILNRNTLKLSYSCMPNMHNLISAHNKLILGKHTQPETNNTKGKECNCRQKDSCPLSGKCLTKSVVYQAIVKREDTGEEKSYVGHIRRANSKPDTIIILTHLETQNIGILPRLANIYGS